jgi:hypothetical protein
MDQNTTFCKIFDDKVVNEVVKTKSQTSKEFHELLTQNIAIKVTRML